MAYVVHWDVSVADGVTRKIAAQIRAWTGYGHAVRLFVLHPAPVAHRSLADLDVELIAASRLDRLKRTAALTRTVASFEPDVIYHRYVTYYPYLARLAATCPLVLEVNTLDDGEYAVAHGRASRTWHRLTRTRLLRRAAGLVCLTGEIDRAMARYERPSVVVSNGIDLDAVTPLPPAATAAPRLVHVATPQSWHGADKIVGLARRFPHWTFDLIGYDRSDVGPSLPGNVHCHGFLDHETYRPLLEQADVAIAPLALHRKRMEEACSLKVREYLARGLPAIIGGRDCDFPNPVPFLLGLPNRPDNVETNGEAIERFVTGWRGRRVPRAAIEHLDHGPKERQRLAFLDAAIARPLPGR